MGFVALCAGSSASAVPFFTDGFEYADGDLTAVSGNLWVQHGGGTFPNSTIKVASQEAVVDIGRSGTPGTMAGNLGIDQDVNQAIGVDQVPGETWYYAAQFSIEDSRLVAGTGTIQTEYFLHFKNNTTSDFHGRLWVASIAGDPSQFNLAVSSSSSSAAAIARWATPLTFGQTYTAVVSYTASEHDGRTELGFPPNNVPNPDFMPLEGEDGWASLWVNPTNSSSTKVTDTAPPGNVGTDILAPQNALALRQGGSGNGSSSTRAIVDIVSTGNNFDEVLAAVGGSAVVEDADFDGDGDVDGADFLTWQRSNGGPGDLADGDANDDSVVNGLDLAVWRAQFGPAAVPAVGVVPEPACLTLVALGMIGAVAAGRRRGR